MFNIKSKMVQAIGLAGGYRLSRWLTRATPKILMYHRFSEAPVPGCIDRCAFEGQVQYLKRHFRVVRLDTLIEALNTPEADLANMVVITVDDGYLDFYEVAYPVLKRMEVPATLFLTTQFVDGDFWLWPDQIRYILMYSVAVDSLSIPGSGKNVGVRLDDVGRDVLWERIVSFLLTLDEQEKLDWITEFARRQGLSVPRAPTDGFRAINWEQAIEMAANGIEIGAHSRTHPSLGKIADEHLDFEIQGSVDDVERQIGVRPSSFCYPNGQPADYNQQVKERVRNAGCRGAVTAFYDASVTDDLFELRRFSVSSNRYQFVKSANGVELLSARWMNSSSKNPYQASQF